jgi:hypothetical protein
MSKIRKLMIACAMAVMMVVLSAPAMAQSYYWNPGWLGTPATTEPEPDWQCGWVWSPEEDDWVWACWLD